MIITIVSFRFYMTTARSLALSLIAKAVSPLHCNTGSKT